MLEAVDLRSKHTPHKEKFDATVHHAFDIKPNCRWIAIQSLPRQVVADSIAGRLQPRPTHLRPLLMPESDDILAGWYSSEWCTTVSLDGLLEDSPGRSGSPAPASAAVPVLNARLLRDFNVALLSKGLSAWSCRRLGNESPPRMHAFCQLSYRLGLELAMATTILRSEHMM